MSRLLWIGVGAAGGIYVYRKGERAWERAKDRGVSGNATLLATTAAHWYARGLAGAELGAVPSAQAAAPLSRAEDVGRAATATPISRARRSQRAWVDHDRNGASGSVTELGHGTGSRSWDGAADRHEAPGEPQETGGIGAGGAAAAGVEALGNWLVRRAAAARSA